MTDISSIKIKLESLRRRDVETKFVPPFKPEIIN